MLLFEWSVTVFSLWLCQVLATLLEKPEKGALLARLVWALGRGIGEYLLQQADWLLQVCCMVFRSATLKSNKDTISMCK